ncbi:hypothetical protein TRFO_30441 [Tritrichomonas foetus]|uniref:Uncharacterized protein n=1 Tax=Tritrichomonas foetus TaxID=1144522 RepID=A0A1J4JUQ6_9EUKA|nr:hypothetical protein TRFO_30441 [Tritrichomonas foetus]|eukprot:OHT02442.1 hypothetical protein TRFO_30441 [Tritrichomonas foetus]
MSVFEQPVHFQTFQTETKIVSYETDVVTNHEQPRIASQFIDIIQMTRSHGLFVIRLRENSIEFLSAGEQPSLKCRINFSHNSLISAPTESEYPFCFIASDYHVFRVDYSENDQKIESVFHSNSKIVSIFAKTNYLYIGDESSNLTCIDYFRNTLKFSKLVDSNIIFQFFIKREILAITGYENSIFVLTSKPSIHVIESEGNCVNSFYLDNINFSNDINGNGQEQSKQIQMKIGKIKGNYVAAIFSENQIQTFSFSKEFKSAKLRSTIFLDNLMLSFSIHNNSLLVTEEIDIDDDQKMTRLYIYSNYSTEPSFEWDMSKEYDFLCQTYGPPSQIEEELNDKLHNISRMFGFKCDSMNKSEIITKCSPLFIQSDGKQNLWVSFEDSVQYLVPISEEIAVFKGMTNSLYIPDTEEEFKNEIPSFDPKNENIIDYIQSFNFSDYEIYEIAGIDPENSDAPHLTISEILSDISRRNGEFIKSISKKISKILYEKEKEKENRVRLGRIARKVYQATPPYLHSYIDSQILHKITPTNKLLYEVAGKFMFECPEYVEDIVNDFEANHSNISECLREFTIKKPNITDCIMQDIEKNRVDSLFKQFWDASVYGLSYQAFKFTTSLLIAVYLVKKASQSATSSTKIQLEGFSQFTSRLENIVQSYASIYQICHCEDAKLEFKLFIYEFASFRQYLIYQYHYILTDVDYLFNCIKDHKSEKEVILFASNMKTPHHILVLALAHLYQNKLDEFLACWKRFRSYEVEVSPLFTQIVEQATHSSQNTEVNYDKYFVEFIKEGERDLMLNYFDSFFKSAIKIHDFDAAFTSLMLNLGKNNVTSKNITAIEILANSMAREKVSRQFIDFAFGVNRSKFLKVMSIGSNVSVFFAATLFNKCGEYSKSAGALLNYVNSVLYKSNVTLPEISKAYTAVILIMSLMKNHQVYVRNPATKRLLHLRDLNNLRAQLAYRSNDQKRYSPKTAAFILSNRKSTEKTPVCKFLANWTNKTQNERFYQFIKNIKNEEVKQQIFVHYFKQQVKSTQFFGLWFQNLFSQHNLPALVRILQEIEVNSKDENTFRSVIFEIINITPKTNSSSGSRKSILGEFPCVIETPFVLQASCKTLALLEMLFYPLTKKCTNPEVLSISTCYNKPIDRKPDNLALFLLCCPRGKVQVTYGDSTWDIEGNKHLCLPKIITHDVSFKGLDDNTLVLYIQIPKN